MMESKKVKDGLLHVRAEGCVINIKEGLFDEGKRKCTSVTIIPDNTEYEDGPAWELKGQAYNRIIKIK